ncbi:MAG TPA: outer membrane beta-barrel protein [Polyangiaceae bacterium]
MSRLIRTVRMLTMVSLGAFAAPLVGQAPPASDPAPAPPPAFKLSGYAEASYVYSTEAVGNAIVGRLYDRYSNAFTLNAWKLAVDRPFNPKKVDAGIHSDLVVGQNAEVLHSGSFALGADGDVTQLYVTLNLPTKSGNGVQFKVGKMVTLTGLEVIEDVANPNWSEGLLFTYVENFTSTGAEFDFKPSNAVDVELRVDNGWDRVVVPDGHKSFMGRVGIAPSGNTTLGLLGYVGDQEPSINAARYGVEGLLNQKFGSKTSVWVQADWGKEKQNPLLADTTQDGSWWALGAWLATDLSPKANVAVRAEYLDDAEGARTEGAYGLGPVPGGPYAAHKLWGLTGTLNMKTWPNVLLRPEVRYDHSNQAPFNNKNGQVSFALSVAYQY